MRWSRASSVAGRSVDASMMDILSAAAIAANQKKQVAVNLNAAVPGIAGAKLTLAIGEPPKEIASNAVGTTGAVVRTTQVRLAFELNVLGTSSIAGIKLRRTFPPRPSRMFRPGTR